MRRRLASRSERPAPAAFRHALMSAPPAERDGWLDMVFGIDAVADDGPDLPRGCVPYLPCPVDALLRLVDQAKVTPADVFVDVGAGNGRAAAAVHFLTGAAAIGIEIQSGMVRASRHLVAGLNASRVSIVEGDAVRLTRFIPIGTVFFLYCPFSGERLERVVDDLESIALTREIRVCSLDLPIPSRRWLAPVPPLGSDLEVHRSTCHRRS